MMALQGFTTSQFANGTVIGSLGTVDDAVIMAGVTLASTVNVIAGTGSGHDVAVFGALSSGASAIALGGDAAADSDARVYVAVGATVRSTATGISLRAVSSEILNDGRITGDVYGISIASDSDITVGIIENGGSIASLQTAIHHTGNEAIAINNTGLIDGGVYALHCTGTGDVVVVNRGIILGELRFGAGDDQLFSLGNMAGNVAMGAGDDIVQVEGVVGATLTLGDGDDTYAGQHAAAGRDLNIYGGAGRDTFAPGGMNERIDGGAGRDTISFAGQSGGVRVYLEGRGAGTGAATGDDYTDIENVTGTASDDFIFGSAAANRLVGHGGGDRLLAGRGADTVIGGSGVDTLSGGGDDDVFVFTALGDCGDTLTDFANSTDDNDLLRVDASGFGGGLVAGDLAPGQFRARADGLAQDANDRFIFNTTKRMLWFDANGNVAGGRVMVADLQAGATFSLADIVLV